MGAGASVNIELEGLSQEELGAKVAELGDAYLPYKTGIISNAVDGEMIANLHSEDEFKAVLKEIGVEKTTHAMKLKSEYDKLKGNNLQHSVSAPVILPVATPITTSTATKTTTANHETIAIAVVESNVDATVKQEPVHFEVLDKITMTPLAIMKKLFEVQGIHLDPSDLDPAVAKIEKSVGHDEKKTYEYDCFINYRVVSDADIAEKLYLYLATKSIKAYLDKKCLKDGEPWKEGFLNGLKNSRKIICLISRDGLKNVRNPTSDHSWDNVLIEYETAIKIKDVSKNKGYIIPVFVGSFNAEDQTLTKFKIATKEYPDSILPIKDAVFEEDEENWVYDDEGIDDDDRAYYDNNEEEEDDEGGEQKSKQTATSILATFGAAISTAIHDALHHTNDNIENNINENCDDDDDDDDKADNPDNAADDDDDDDDGNNNDDQD